MIKNKRGLLALVVVAIVFCLLSVVGCYYWRGNSANKPQPLVTATPTPNEAVLSLPTPQITPIIDGSWKTTDIRQGSNLNISHPTYFYESEEEKIMYPNGHVTLYGASDSVNQVVEVIFRPGDGGDNFDNYVSGLFKFFHRVDNGESTGGVLYETKYVLGNHRVAVISYKHVQDRTMLDLVPDSIHSIFLLDVGSDVVEVSGMHTSFSEATSPLDNTILNMLTTVE